MAMYSRFKTSTLDCIAVLGPAVINHLTGAVLQQKQAIDGGQPSRRRHRRTDDSVLLPCSIVGRILSGDSRPDNCEMAQLPTSHGSAAPAGGSFTTSTPVTSACWRTSSSASGEGSLSRFRTATAS